MKRPSLATSLAVGYTVALIVLGLRYHFTGDLESESDFFTSYVPNARSFLDGTVAVGAYRGPVYPIVLACLSVLLQPFGAGLFETGIVLSSVSAGLVLLVTYRLGRTLYSTSVGAAAALLLALNPVFIRYSYTTGTDMFFCALSLSAVWAFLHPSRRRRAWVAAAAVLATLAYLTRYNGVFLFATFAIALLIDTHQRSRSDRVYDAAVFAAIAFALIVPWGLYCRAESGRFFYNDNFMNIAYAFYKPAGMTMERFAENTEGRLNGFLDVVRFDAGRFFSRLPGKVALHLWKFAGRVVTWPAAVVAATGVVLLPMFRLRRGQLVFYLSAAMCFSLLVLVFFSERFALFLLPITLVLAAHTIDRLAAVRRLGPAVLIIATALLAGYGAARSVSYDVEHIGGGDPAVRDFAEEFRRQAPPGFRSGIVAARKPFFGYFAGLETRYLPLLDDHDTLLDFLHSSDADYLYFDRLASRMRPDLAYLLDSDARPPGLAVIAVAAGDDGRPHSILYRVRR